MGSAACRHYEAALIDVMGLALRGCQRGTRLVHVHEQAVDRLCSHSK